MSITAQASNGLAGHCRVNHRIMSLRGRISGTNNGHVKNSCIRHSQGSQELSRSGTRYEKMHNRHFAVWCSANYRPVFFTKHKIDTLVPKVSYLFTFAADFSHRLDTQLKVYRRPPIGCFSIYLFHLYTIGCNWHIRHQQ